MSRILTTTITTATSTTLITSTTKTSTTTTSTTTTSTMSTTSRATTTTTSTTKRTTMHQQQWLQRQQLWCQRSRSQAMNKTYWWSFRNFLPLLIYWRGFFCGHEGQKRPRRLFGRATFGENPRRRSERLFPFFKISGGERIEAFGFVTVFMLCWTSEHHLKPLKPWANIIQQRLWHVGHTSDHYRLVAQVIYLIRGILGSLVYMRE